VGYLHMFYCSSDAIHLTQELSCLRTRQGKGLNAVHEVTFPVSRSSLRESIERSHELMEPLTVFVVRTVGLQQNAHWAYEAPPASYERLVLYDAKPLRQETGPVESHLIDDERRWVICGGHVVQASEVPDTKLAVQVRARQINPSLKPRHTLEKEPMQNVIDTLPERLVLAVEYFRMGGGSGHI
jgi:hypothetical protein